MQLQNITAVIFSATGNSKKLALAAARGMGKETPKLLDCTAKDAVDQQVTLSEQEAAVFCAPVYAGRIPPTALEHLSRVKGCNTPAVVMVSFGNRDYDDALLELCDHCRKNGFVPVVAGAFVGKHTFGSIAVDRPNAEDLKQATALGELAAQTLAQVGAATELPPLWVQGNCPYKELKKLPCFAPKTGGSCNRCGACVKACPTGAIDAHNPSRTDKSRCISCFACVKTCPKQAKAPAGLLYRAMAGVLTKKLSTPVPNQVFASQGSSEAQKVYNS